MSTAASSYAEKVFRLNSMYDPDYSGVGSQPLGYDQWTAFYQRYKVLGVKYKCSFAAPTSLTESMVSVIPNLVATTDTGATNALAEPYAKMSLWSPNGGWKPVLSGYVDMRKILGLTKEEFGEENYSAAYNADPTSVVWFHVRVDTATAGFSGSVYFLLELDFDCEFYQRQELDLSLWKEFMLYRKSIKTKEIEEDKPSSSANVLAGQESNEKDYKLLLAKLLNK